jgi:dihydrofolate reductase
MSKTHCDISMSVDGFITGPNAGVGNPLGDDDGRLHAWMFESKTDADAEVLAEAYERTGAIIMGRRMFDVGVEPWGDPPPFERPVIVLTHERQAPMEMQGGTTYYFNDGLETALAQAKEAAGARDVGIWGGADVMRQYLQAKLLDEIQIHLVPVLLGDGTTPLFAGLPTGLIELERARTIATPAATHLRFVVR